MSNYVNCYVLKLFIIGLLFFFAPAAYGRPVGKTKDPFIATVDSQWNVILITISSLRADHVGCLGYERETTPNFDEFAQKNLFFSNVYAASSWMMPAYGSIFTSLYPSDHGATHINNSLSSKHQTLAEILNSCGYYCIGFCCNPRLDTEHGFAQGFDLYDDYSVPMMLQSLELDGAEADINKSRTNSLVNDAAIRWLQRNTHRPFFMFLHYYDNHWDYLPPKPYDTEYDPDYEGPIDGTDIAKEPLFSNSPSEEDIEHILALYDGEVRQTDEDLGEMLDYLESNGLMDNSLVIVMGDHGEQFYEHGNTSHHGTFDELLHVPLAISTPTQQAQHRKIESLISQVDIMPTILEHLSIPVPAQCQGRSLMSILKGNTNIANEYIFAEYTGGAAPDSYIVRSHNYKCCQADGSKFAYDLTNDPGEQRKIDTTDFTPEIVLLEKQLEEWLKCNGVE